MDEYCGYDVEDVHSGTELDEVMCEMCGTIQPATNKFCSHCGESFKKVIKNDAIESFYAYRKRKKRALVMFIATFVAIFVIYAIMIATSILSKGKSPKQPQKEFVVPEISVSMPEISIPEISVPDISDFTVSEEDLSEIQQNEHNFKGDYFPMGWYAVGIDIPEGEYLLVADEYSEFPNSYIGVYDEYGTEIVSAMFQNTFYVTVKDGQQLDLSWCTAIDLDSNEFENNPFEHSGMFKAGTDFEAGTYRIEEDNDEYPCYFLVFDSFNEYDAYELYTETLDYEINDREKIITVEDGQYIQLENCVIVKEE